ncbi:MAG: 50S ribosomal protein L21 [Actinomycetota bacterium]|nr:50S ribosomal protein L21 [Actinomycetota bacterium]
MKSGGKQLKVEPGKIVSMEKLDSKVGDVVEFNEVLLLSSEKEKLITPGELEKVKVMGTVVEQTKASKIIVFKYKARKGYKRKNGHRQLVTKVMIDEFSVGGKTLGPAETAKPVSKKVKEETEVKVSTEIKEDIKPAVISEVQPVEEKTEAAKKAPVKKATAQKPKEKAPAKTAKAKESKETAAVKKEAKPAQKKAAIKSVASKEAKPATKAAAKPAAKKAEPKAKAKENKAKEK